MVRRIRDWLAALLTDRQEGQGLVEYALILVTISVVSIVVLGVLGTTVSGVFATVQAAMASP